MYVEGKHQGHRIAFSDFPNFVLFGENNDFAEFMVNLIHRKRVPLLHKTVFILCDKGYGLVAVLKPETSSYEGILVFMSS